MSYIRWIPPPSAGRSAWRFFPLGIVLAMTIVVAVNGGLIYAALHSFPGKAGDEGFALSNHYDSVLEQARHEAALGWTILVRTDDAGRPVVVLTDRGNAPLRGAAVAALAARPVGAEDSRPLVFSETDAGRYVADAALPGRGQWDLTLSASANGHDMAATRRVIVR